MYIFRISPLYQNTWFGVDHHDARVVRVTGGFAYMTAKEYDEYRRWGALFESTLIG